jgi:hypothetical protein
MALLALVISPHTSHQLLQTGRCRLPVDGHNAPPLSPGTSGSTIEPHNDNRIGGRIERGKLSASRQRHSPSKDLLLRDGQPGVRCLPLEGSAKLFVASR